MPHWRCYYGAAQALGSIGPPAKEAVPALLEMLEDKNKAMGHIAAKRALKRIDAEAASDFPRENAAKNNATPDNAAPATSGTP